MYNPNRIAQLFMLYTLGELSPAEEAELNGWRRESIRNEELFQYETNPKNIALTFKEIGDKKDPIFQKIKEAYPQPWAGKIRNLWPRVHIPYRLEVAMWLVVLSVVGFLVYNKWDKGRIKPASYKANLISFDGVDKALNDFHRGFNDGFSGVRVEKDRFGNLVYHTPNDSTASKDKYNILYTPRGGYYDIRFPDGSLVILNAESSIRYPANYNRDSIKVVLNGEAYFEVKRDSLHPFMVDIKRDSNTARIDKRQNNNVLSDFQVVVSHGHFNVKAYTNEPLITVTMVEGNSRIGADSWASDPGSLLVAGMEATEIDQTFVMIRDADTSTAIAWKNGRFFYKRAGIAVIMNAVSRWYNVPISYHDSIPDRAFHLDVARDASIHEVFRSLGQQGLYCDIEDRRIHVRNRQ